MRFTSLLLSGLLAVASAQTTETSTTTPTTLDTVTSTTTSESPAQTSETEVVKCINACTPGDVGCTAKCIAVPNPDQSAVNATNNCVAACPQGSGTAADNLNYKNCVDACIGKYYFTASETTATQATDSPSGTESGVVVVVTTTDASGMTVTSTTTSAEVENTAAGGGSGSGSASGIPTGTGSAAPTASGNGAGTVGAGTVVGGIVGLVAAVMAL